MVFQGDAVRSGKQTRGNTRPMAPLVLAFLPALVPNVSAAEVSRFGLFEESFEQTKSYSNPYTQVSATGLFTGPDGRKQSIPLFFDGGSRWKLRFSPDAVGTWRWQTRGNDPGLDGKSGSFQVVDSGLPGGIRPMAGYGRHFERQDGTPFWFVGDTGWALYTDSQEEKHDRSTVRNYIDVRARQGFNVVHSMLLSEAGWGNSGGAPFGDLEAERINPGYWREVDSRLAYLNRRGITGGLVLAWADKGRNPNDWKEFPSFEARKRYARYIAARYAALDVYFIVAGEWNFDGMTDDVRAGFVALGNVIRQNDPHGRMVAIHPGGAGSDGTVKEFAQAPWMAFGDYQQNYRRLHETILRARRHGRPVVNSEYAYYLRDRDGDGKLDKPNSTSLESIRHATWDIAMAGGYFITGFGTTYFGGNRDPGPFDVDAPKNDAWEEDVRHVMTFFTDLDWWRLEPHDELIAADVERTEDRREGRVVLPPAIAYWTLAEPGRQYVVYVRGYHGRYTLSLGTDKPGTYRLEQFDPRTGKFSPLDSYQGKGPIDYTPPDDRDWVMLVRAESSAR